MEFVFFLAALASGAALALFLVAALAEDAFAFWPPPAPDTWQDLVFWGLFRLFCAGTALTALAALPMPAWEDWPRLALGAPLMLGGLGAMVWLYGFLGLANTYGDRAGLVTNGVYAFSRNPQYVASVAGALGAAAVADSGLTLILAGALAGLYALMALNEERWLFAKYGRAYADYMLRAPRFFDMRSVLRAREAMARRF